MLKTQRAIQGVAISGLCLLLLACASCGGGGKADNAAQVRSTDGFTLTVLGDSFYGGGAVDNFALRVEPAAKGDPQGQVRVAISADRARGLRALYFTLAYNTAEYTPVAAKASGELASGTPAPADNLLELAVLNQPGLVNCGQVLVHPDAQAGFSGSAVLATVSFAKKPFSRLDNKRSISLAPTADASKALLAVDVPSATLLWGYYSQGDYNQDREVGINDLTPLGVHFGENTGGAGPFPADTIQAVVDGDSNGEINISDITPIGANFGRLVQTYRVYESATGAEYPANNDDLSTLAAMAELPYESFTGDRTVARVQYSYVLAAPAEGAFYWVRPADGTSEGTPSSTANYVTGGNNPPVAGLLANVLAGDAPLDVGFDASSSTDSDTGDSITKYEFDFEGDGTFELDNGAVATTNHQYAVPGTYDAAVRVSDAGSPPLTDTASVTITVNTPTGNQPPVVNLVGDASSGTAPLTVNFTATASDPDGTVVSWDYDWEGDGTFDEIGDTDDTNSHTFGAAGTFNTTVRVTDDGGATAEDTFVVTVAPPAGPTWNIWGLVVQWDGPQPGGGAHGINGVTVELHHETGGALMASDTSHDHDFGPPSGVVAGYFEFLGVPENDGSDGGYYIIPAGPPPGGGPWGPPGPPPGKFPIPFLFADRQGVNIYDQNGF